MIVLPCVILRSVNPHDKNGYTTENKNVQRTIIRHVPTTCILYNSISYNKRSIHKQ